MRQNPVTVSFSLIGIICLLSGIILLLLPHIPYPVIPIWSSHPLFSNLSGVLIGAGLVQLLIQLFAAKSLVDKVASEILSRLHLSLEAFYENRHTLPDLSKTLANASEVWFAVHSGTILGVSGLHSIAGQIKKIRIIVTDPESDFLDQHAEIYNISKGTLQHSIRDLIKKAQESKIEIKCYDGPIGNSVIIVNPSSRDGWARVESLAPYGDPVDRPSFKVSLRKGKKAFQTILTAYKQLWKESKKPPKV